MSLEMRRDEIRAIPEGDLENVVNKLKGNVLTLVNDGGSGHCGGCLSMLKALFMHYRMVPDDGRPGPHLSKGHCVPAFYALSHQFGNITGVEMAGFRTIGGLSGHADKRVQSIASGVLGLGGSINGMARAEKLKGTNRKIYGFFGDGELDAPALWGSLRTAGNEGLNVCFVVDYNKKNLTGELYADFKRDLKAMESFGFQVIEAANNFDDLKAAYELAEECPGPVALIVDSIKGEGVSFMENDPSGWHGSSLNDEQYRQGMKELGQEPTTFRKEPVSIVRSLREREAMARLVKKGFGLREAPTRMANKYLAELGEGNNKLVVLTADLKGSVNVGNFEEKFPERFFDKGINEMEATLEAMGLSVCGFKPVFSTFDGFTYVPFPAVRMADYSKIPFLIFTLTHAEFLGEDGPTHQIMENLGAWRGLYNIEIIANPVDIVQARDTLGYSVKIGGLSYIRLGRPSVPTIYDHRSLPLPGKADVLIEGDKTAPLIISTGQAVYESLIAAELLGEEGIHPTVVNVGYFKPFDTDETILREAAGRLVVVPEVHNPNVGLNSMVALHLAENRINCQRMVPIGVTGYVPSGSITAQKKHCGLLGEQIYEKIKLNL